MQANVAKGQKKQPVFLTIIAAEAYEVLKKFVVPASLSEEIHDEAKRFTTEHYSPRGSVIAKRCRYNRRMLREGESVANFIVELKHLAKKSDYGDFLQHALRSRLLKGVRMEETQPNLFVEEKLTFESA
ncbi:hypothetical protein HPB49_015699 [Dermacentor silvarum]|uniref:Uncharacterized protein n=1 Tax=Dermacentor silvarum TaxID=543639 RepID=A0ACB8CYA6_DERSI|nr:hypothetical protein HPB49_015699 [Dermacentor silvarum]